MSADSAALAQAAMDALVVGTPAPWPALRSDRRVPDAPGLYAVHAHDPELILIATGSEVSLAVDRKSVV